LSSEAQEWAWSSAAHHLGLRQDRLVADHPTYWALGNTPFERERRYRDFLEAGTSEREAARITEAALKGWALGSTAFLQSQAQTAARPLEPRPRGRPRKDPAAQKG
jgi:putative transposase